MPCRARMVAGALLLVAAGCSPNLLTVSAGGPEGKEHVVPGSVARVSALLQSTLADAGVAVLEKRQGPEVRLAGSTSSHRVFCLLLRPAPGESCRTVLTVKWGGEPDEEFWQTVLQAVASPPKGTDHADRPAGSGRTDS